MADTQTEAPVAEPDETGTPAEDGKRPRRRLFIILGVLLGIVVYALAFQQTEVRLDQITSETRQQSLTRILRSLARPDLVTYETDPQITEIDLGVPCGPALATDPALVATPACGEPGDVITVTGSGFDPRELVEIVFVPDSDFDITLRLTSTNADSAGNISAEIILPDRVSEEPQQLRAVTQEPIGTWGNRVEVYTDANENGAEDNPTMGDSGSYTFSVAGRPEIPAVALINPASEVTQVVSSGDSFDAINGPATGQTAIPLAEATDGGALTVTSIDTGGGNVNVTVTGSPGTDMSSWRAAVYDGSTGEVGNTNFISDTIALSPRISQTALITIDKILETVFLALVATSAGLLLAIPLSFVAARNIMRDISVTVTNLVLILIAVPLGAFGGVLLARLARTMVDPIGTNGWGLAGALVVALAVAGALVRMTVVPTEAEIPSPAERIRRGVGLVAAGVAGLIGLLILSRLFQVAGTGLADVLGPFGFIGAFFSSIGEILDVALTVIAALATAGVASHLASKLGYSIRRRISGAALRLFNLVFGAAAGALWAIIVGQIVDWFYQIDDATAVVVIPAVVGAVGGIIVSWRGMSEGEVDVGLSIYYGARTLFNTLRSIEPLIMAIVFVTWVGLGPFAGSLALALHTAAALAKLYSEQVESISAGPIEAVRATGANRLQTIIYAVVPQIIPPYISFTMYRWDINVRMSTILGFVGGGGIGSILQQNINLLQYRAAAVQMLAIAIVVATMDWASSRMRERFV